MDNNKDKARKVVKGVAIFLRIILVLIGIALICFFAWLAVQIGTWISGV